MLSLKNWMIKVTEALNIRVVDYTATTGSTQYAGWYYANITLSQSDPVAMYIYSATSNRPAFVQRTTTNGVIRVYSNQAGVDITVRCLYCPTI